MKPIERIGTQSQPRLRLLDSGPRCDDGAVHLGLFLLREPILYFDREFDRVGCTVSV